MGIPELKENSSRVAGQSSEWTANVNRLGLFRLIRRAEQFGRNSADETPRYQPLAVGTQIISQTRNHVTFACDEGFQAVPSNGFCGLLASFGPCRMSSYFVKFRGCST